MQGSINAKFSRLARTVCGRRSKAMLLQKPVLGLHAFCTEVRGSYPADPERPANPLQIPTYLKKLIEMCLDCATIHHPTKFEVG